MLQPFGCAKSNHDNWVLGTIWAEQRNVLFKNLSWGDFLFGTLPLLFYLHKCILLAEVKGLQLKTSQVKHLRLFKIKSLWYSDICTSKFSIYSNLSIWLWTLTLWHGIQYFHVDNFLVNSLFALCSRVGKSQNWITKCDSAIYCKTVICDMKLKTSVKWQTTCEKSIRCLYEELSMS